MSPRPCPEDKHRCVLLKNCMVVVCRRLDARPNKSAGTGPGPPPAAENDCDEKEPEASAVEGWALFQGFVHENAQCFWNPCLVQSVSCLEYRGFLIPATILVSGTEYSMEVVRSAWSRRVLRPPVGYEIQRLGDITSVEMTHVLQTQFAPLAEALCKAVFDLTSAGGTATLDTISSQLAVAFPGMERPGSDVVYRTLGALIRERRLYHTGVGYQVAAPDSFLQTSSTLSSNERPMLLTNEEAISKLHGSPVKSSQANQAEDVDSSGGGTLERSASMRLLRAAREKDESRLSRSNSVRLCRAIAMEPAESKSDSENQVPTKRDKLSVFSRWFRRSRSEKHPSAVNGKKQASFSAQFPPLEWNDPDYVHFHSRATQTLERDNHHTVKIRSASLPRSRERHASSAVHESPTRTDERRKSSRSTRLPRKSFPVAEAEAAALTSRRRSASPARRPVSSRHQTSTPVPPSHIYQSVSSPQHSADRMASPSVSKSHRHRALPAIPAQQHHPEGAAKLNNAEHRQEERFKLNYTNNALQRGTDNTAFKNLHNGTPPMSTSTLNRSEGDRVMSRPLSVKNIQTPPLMSQRKADKLRPGNSISLKNLQNSPILPHLDEKKPQTASSASSLRSTQEKQQSTNNIHTAQNVPLLMTATPVKQQSSSLLMTTTTNSTDDVTLKNKQNLNEEKTKIATSDTITFKNLHNSPSKNTMSTVKQSDGKISIEVEDRKIPTDDIMKEKLEAQKKASSPSIKKVIEETKSTIETSSTTGKDGNLKSTVDVNMEVVTEHGSSRTVTNITTSLSHGALKEWARCSTPTKTTKTTCSSPVHKSKSADSSPVYSPIRVKLAEAKAAFFADSANKGSADDSGFVSASPRPLHVSP